MTREKFLKIIKREISESIDGLLEFNETILPNFNYVIKMVCSNETMLKQFSGTLEGRRELIKYSEMLKLLNEKKDLYIKDNVVDEETYLKIRNDVEKLATERASARSERLEKIFEDDAADVQITLNGCKELVKKGLYLLLGNDFEEEKFDLFLDKLIKDVASEYDLNQPLNQQQAQEAVLKIQEMAINLLQNDDEDENGKM